MPRIHRIPIISKHLNQDAERRREVMKERAKKEHQEKMKQKRKEEEKQRRAEEQQKKENEKALDKWYGHDIVINPRWSLVFPLYTQISCTVLLHLWSSMDSKAYHFVIYSNALPCFLLPANVRDLDNNSFHLLLDLPSN